MDDICTSGDLCLALTKSGQVYGWGNNEYNQISSSNIDQIPTPQLIPIEGKERASNIYNKLRKIN